VVLSINLVRDVCVVSPASVADSIAHSHSYCAYVSYSGWRSSLFDLHWRWSADNVIRRDVSAPVTLLLMSISEIIDMYK